LRESLRHPVAIAIKYSHVLICKADTEDPDPGNREGPPMTNRMICSTAAITMLAGLGLSTAASAQEAFGEWLRPDGTIALTTECDGGLCGELISGEQTGMVMFQSLKSSGDDQWKGDMKHPDMPGFMTFNGTVTLGDGELMVQGCAVGGSMCDAETWVSLE